MYGKSVAIVGRFDGAHLSAIPVVPCAHDTTGARVFGARPCRRDHDARHRDLTAVDGRRVCERTRHAFASSGALDAHGADESSRASPSATDSGTA